MTQVSYLKLQEKYGGEFIAARRNRVLAHDRTMEGLFKALKRKRVPYGPTVRISRIHPRDSVCIY